MSELPKSQTKTWILIPVFNRMLYLPDLIESLSKQSFQDFKVLLVDHGTDPVFLEHPKLHILKESPSLWFTGAINAGLRWLEREQKNFDFVLMMNDDVKISDRDFLSKLVSAAKVYPRTIISTMATNLEGKVDYAGIRLDWLKFKYRALDVGSSVDSLNQDPIDCDALPTRSTLVPRSALQDVGLLDEEHFPQYASDYEWTIRAKKRGYRLLMLRSTHISTEGNEDLKSICSGRKVYPSKPLRSFLQDLFNDKRSQSFYMIRNFSRAVFPIPYRWFYFIFQLSKLCLGFAYTNYLKRA